MLIKGSVLKFLGTESFGVEVRRKVPRKVHDP